VQLSRKRTVGTASDVQRACTAASLNPTYNYGKRASDTDNVEVVSKLDGQDS
jgi:hypothetical protein